MRHYQFILRPIRMKSRHSVMPFFLALLSLTACCVVALAEPDSVTGKARYQNDFEKAALDKVPDDFVVQDGTFSVKAENGNQFLELAGAPVDTFGLSFGPAGSANVGASARVFGTGKGLRGPVFGIGLSGGGGYKLLIAPGKKHIELVKGEQLLVSAPYRWESGTWTMLRLQVRKVKEGEWRIEGKAWKQGAPEPASWLLAWDDHTEPFTSRATIWGSPISGTPIRYDDLAVSELGR